MFRSTPPPTLPPDLVDGLQDALERITAVADLLEVVGTFADPGHLRDRTLTEAAGLILDEADRMLALIRAHAPSINPDPSEP